MHLFSYFDSTQVQQKSSVIPGKTFSRVAVAVQDLFLSLKTK